MQELSDAFSNYLRFSFDFYNADSIVPLKHELAFVRSYLYFEQTGFDEQLSIEWRRDENTNFSLPPLTYSIACRKCGKTWDSKKFRRWKYSYPN